ncbi:MAG TPA: hypothetical protein VGQ03_00150 [Nitrososphaera sp.]|nr:hypothetical protein [Nitrososphaera sp.]
MTGETQLRAKRTRIKILRAIAERNGTAGFSDIKVTTGLSTGSIYYHLEKMSNYVTKDAKHYVITEEGLGLLRETDSRFAKAPPSHGKEERVHGNPDEARGTDDREPEESVARRDFSKLQRIVVFGGLALLGTLGMLHIALSGNLALIPLRVNSAPIMFIALATALTLFFLFRRRLVIPQAMGYRGLMFSILSVAGVLSGVVFLSAPFGAGAPHYDNSMDALLSSYSLHWQVR